MNAKATVTARISFETIVHQHSDKILYSHAYNDLLDTKVFCAANAKIRQTLTLCGVNAHHQNGIAKRRIQDITVGTRTSLLHTSHC